MSEPRTRRRYRPGGHEHGYAPCPCGEGYAPNVVQVSESEWLWAVCCDACDAEGPVRRTPYAAIRAWNADPGDAIEEREGLGQ